LKIQVSSPVAVGVTRRGHGTFPDATRQMPARTWYPEPGNRKLTPTPKAFQPIAPGWRERAYPGKTCEAGHAPRRACEDSGTRQRPKAVPDGSGAPSGAGSVERAGPTAHAVGYRLSVLRTCPLTEPLRDLQPSRFAGIWWLGTSAQLLHVVCYRSSAASERPKQVTPTKKPLSASPRLRCIPPPLSNSKPCRVG
jgi:hypothetical protein